MQAAGRRVQGPTQKPEVALDAAEAAASRMLLQYSMHPLTTDEQVTCQSMLVQEPSSRVLVMPTHHINELGDMMGFRWRHAIPLSFPPSRMPASIELSIKLVVCLSGSSADLASGPSHRSRVLGVHAVV